GVSAGFLRTLHRRGRQDAITDPPHMLRHACGFKLANDGQNPLPFRETPAYARRASRAGRFPDTPEIILLLRRVFSCDPSHNSPTRAAPSSSVARGSRATKLVHGQQVTKSRDTSRHGELRVTLWPGAVRSAVTRHRVAVARHYSHRLNWISI